MGALEVKVHSRNEDATQPAHAADAEQLPKLGIRFDGWRSGRWRAADAQPLDGTEEAMLSANQAKIHPCGYPIFVEVVWNGIAYRPIFNDGDENSVTAGQRIFECPRCGEHIMKRDFEEPSNKRVQPTA